jgi:hypothetical protein
MILIRISEIKLTNIFVYKTPPPYTYMNLHKSIQVPTKNTITIQYIRIVVNNFTCLAL